MPVFCDYNNKKRIINLPQQGLVIIGVAGAFPHKVCMQKLDN